VGCGWEREGEEEKSRKRGKEKRRQGEGEERCKLEGKKEAGKERLARGKGMARQGIKGATGGFRQAFQAYLSEQLLRALMLYRGNTATYATTVRDAEYRAAQWWKTKGSGSPRAAP